MFKKVLAGGLTLGTAAFAYSRYNIHFIPSNKSQVYANRYPNSDPNFDVKKLDQTKIDAYIIDDHYSKIAQIKIPSTAITNLNRSTIANVETAEYETNDAIASGIEMNTGERGERYMHYGKGNHTIVNGLRFEIDKPVTTTDGRPPEKPIKFYLTYEAAFSRTNNVHDGIVTRYYPEGQIKSETCYYEHNKNGTHKSYYPDGKLCETGINRNDKPKGTWIWRDQEKQNYEITIHL